MERDFMGLAVNVKEETPDVIYDADPVRSWSLATQWSFPNKASKEDKPKTGFESLASTGLVTITTSDANQKSYPGINQQNIVHEKQFRGRYLAANYLLKRHETHNILRQVTGQTNLSGVSMTNHVPAKRSSGPLVGTTDLKTSAKISEGPSQLTIFYRGSVCVYDNIPTEKAQTIMLLAGNSPPMTSSPMSRAAPVQASMPISSVLDGFVGRNPNVTIPHHSSPVPINSLTVSQTAVKPTGILVSSSNKGVNPIRSVPVTMLLSSDTIPQFRRKSLARFLEKRKERVINALPYADKKSPDCGVTGAGSTSLTTNSSGSCHVQPVN